MNNNVKYRGAAKVNDNNCWRRFLTSIIAYRLPSRHWAIIS